MATAKRCACGKRLIGKQRDYCSDRCRKRQERRERPQRAVAKPSEPKTYPLYLDSFTRLNRCEKHGEIYSQVGHQFRSNTLGTINATSSQGPHYQPCEPINWHGECEQCKAEEKARIEGLKAKAGSACESRTCKCPAPKCEFCGRSMQQQPGVAGYHDYRCALPEHWQEKSLPWRTEA